MITSYSNVVPIREFVRSPDSFSLPAPDYMTVEELDYFTDAPVHHVVVRNRVLREQRTMRDLYDAGERRSRAR